MARTGLRPKLRELLSDGEWHRFPDLYAEVWQLIPEQTAVRRYAGLRKDGRSYPEQVEFGRREIVRSALYLMRADRRGGRGVPLGNLAFRLRPKMD